MKGYHRIKEGKSILFKISKATNKYRYNNRKNNNVKLPTDKEIEYLFSLSPIYSENKKLTYNQLIKEYSVKINSRKGYIVYVYENGKEINLSPFLSYRSASKILNLSSKIISIYIDTGTLYKNKYMFSSCKIQ
jgi:hypothetical protein